ncbi:MAG TPA: four helix bundle protein [Tepidisphaeraceae bacterium]|nr:four helix bundle protein [Tepidisphaeraceae bacterium]
MKAPRELDITGRTFAFAARVVRLCRTIERSAVNRALIGQLLRASTSIGANIEEAQSGQSRADFLSKVTIALKEAREAHYWLRLLVETEIVSRKRTAELLDESNQIICVLTAIVKSTKRPPTIPYS